MRKHILEKIFGFWFFIILNIAIIFAVESTGMYFFNTGILHAIALFFVLLAVIRIFIHYKTYDQFLDKIKHASIAALFIFAVSHVMEYINFAVYHRYDDAVFATTVNFYLVGLISIVIGAELFLTKYDHRSNLSVEILYPLAIALTVWNIVISFNRELISLEPDSLFPYAYALLAIILLAAGIKKMLRLKRKISISVGFLNYMIGSMCFMAVAMFTNIFYELLEEVFGIPMFQIMYASHFFFFISLSVMFLSYKKLINLPGIYAEADKLASS